MGTSIEALVQAPPSVNVKRKLRASDKRNLHTLGGRSAAGVVDVPPSLRLGRADVSVRPPHRTPQLLVSPHPVAVAADVDDVAVVQQAVDQGRRHGLVVRLASRGARRVGSLKCLARSWRGWLGSSRLAPDPADGAHGHTRQLVDPLLD